MKITVDHSAWLKGGSFSYNYTITSLLVLLFKSKVYFADYCSRAQSVSYPANKTILSNI